MSECAVRRPLRMVPGEGYNGQLGSLCDALSRRVEKPCRQVDAIRPKKSSQNRVVQAAREEVPQI